MFKKLFFLCLSLSLLNGCLKSNTTSDTLSSDTIHTFSLNIPVQATDIKLSFKYKTDNPNDLNFYIRDCVIPAINQETPDGNMTTDIKRFCLEKGGYDVTLNLNLNHKVYRGSSYILRNTTIKDNYLIPHKITLQSTNGDDLEIVAIPLPDEYEYIGQKTIDSTIVHILHIKIGKDICNTTGHCKPLGNSDTLNSKPLCVGATSSQDTFNFEYGCYSSVQ